MELELHVRLLLSLEVAKQEAGNHYAVCWRCQRYYQCRESERLKAHIASIREDIKRALTEYGEISRAQ